MEACWSEALGEVLEVEGLTCGCYAFNFKQQEHVQWVLDRNWSLDHTLVLLKPWISSFDASRERVDVVPLWVQLPGLPRQYCSEDHFTNIGNILGSYLEVDMSFKTSKLQRVARILVNINIWEVWRKICC